MSQELSEKSIQVVGTSAAVSSFLVGQILRYSADLVKNGITELVITVNDANTVIEYYKIDTRTRYKIALKEKVAQRFSAAIDRAENAEQIRPEIREALINHLLNDFHKVLDEVFKDARKRS